MDFLAFFFFSEGSIITIITQCGIILRAGCEILYLVDLFLLPNGIVRTVLALALVLVVQ